MNGARQIIYLSMTEAKLERDIIRAGLGLEEW
jgi:hypothetical protein